MRIFKRNAALFLAALCLVAGHLTIASATQKNDRVSPIRAGTRIGTEDAAASSGGNGTRGGGNSIVNCTFYSESSSQVLTVAAKPTLDTFDDAVFETCDEVKCLSATCAVDAKNVRVYDRASGRTWLTPLI